MTDILLCPWMSCRVQTLDFIWKELIEIVAKDFVKVHELENKKFIICPKNKNCNCDVVIPKSALVLIAKTCQLEVDQLEPYLNKLADRTLEFLEGWRFDNKGNYCTSVKKSVVYNHVIENCLKRNGRNLSEVNSSENTIIFCLISEDCNTLSDLRTLLLAAYFKNQSLRNGHHCDIVLSNSNISKFPTALQHALDINEIVNLKLSSEIGEKIQSTKLLVENNYPSIDDCKMKNVSLAALNEEWKNELNLTPDLNHAFRNSFDALHESVTFHSCLSALKSRHNRAKCLFISSSHQRLKLKQVFLFEKFVMKNECLEAEFLTHANGDRSSKAESFFTNRIQQIKSSFESKNFGSNERIPDDTLMEAAVATTTLEVLLLSSTTPIREKNDVDTKCTFILYNYARLMMLMQTFHQKVTEGEYPALSDMESVDFGLLQQIAEWNVVRDGLWLLQDKLYSSNTKPHILVTYLHELASLASIFYSRHHILSQNLSHLLPLLYARIYLVKAILFSMDELFAALNVTPLKKM